MTFREWVDGQGRSDADRRTILQRVAIKCRCTCVNVRYWYRGARPIPPRHAYTIENLTAGAVKAVEVLQGIAA